MMYIIHVYVYTSLAISISVCIHIHTAKQWHIEVRALALLPLVKILKNQSYSIFPQWIWHRADFSELAAAAGKRTSALLSMVKISKRPLATQCTVYRVAKTHRLP